MRTDFQIAVLLGLAGIAAGAALMTAPEYIRTVKEYPAPFFWAGLVLAVALTAVAIVIAVRSEAAEPEFGNTRRMIALGGMVISGLAFVGSASAYFWPMSRRESVLRHRSVPADV